MVSRSGEKRPYIVTISPIRNVGFENGFGVPGAIAIIKDPDCSLQVAAENLKELFYLTPAEARLAAKFFETSSLFKAARELKLTEGTARQYLKRVFLKTGASNQAGLIKALSSLANVANFN